MSRPACSIRVVHRDIKPENVLLSGRTALVADFGIAKALTVARSAEHGATLTSAGQSIGTPAYMPPEQAAGDPADHRADVYAWGMLAYELLNGAHPFAGKKTAAQLIAAQIAERPPSLELTQPALPLPLATLVMQCLEKDAGARPASATALLEALDSSASGDYARGGRASPSPVGISKPTWRMGAAVVVAVLLVGATGWLTRDRWRRSSPSVSATPSLAVLPFEHLGDSADVYLTEGITDEIRGKLMEVHGISVIDRRSSTQFRSGRESAADIGKALSVRYILNGTVRVIGTGANRRIIVRPELVELTSDQKATGRWQQPFDAAFTDVLRVQGDIATRVVDAMQVAMSDVDRERVVRVATRDAAAYESYLKGQNIVGWGSRADAVTQTKAIPYFEDAVRRDSLMMDAWFALTRARSLEYANGTNASAEKANRTLLAAERAVALDPRGALGLSAMSTYQRLVLRDFKAALRTLQEARRRAPNDPTVLGRLAVLLEQSLGQPGEAIPLFKQLQQIDPLNPLWWMASATALSTLGRHDEAYAVLRKARTLGGSTPEILTTELVVDLAQGDSAEARRRMKQHVNDLLPEELVFAFTSSFGAMMDSVTLERVLAVTAEQSGLDQTSHDLSQAFNNALNGRRETARWIAAKILPSIESRANAAGTRTRDAYIDLALTYAVLGRRQAAVLSLARADSLLDRVGASDASSVRQSSLSDMATVAMLAGDNELALTLLRRVWTYPTTFTPISFRVNPAFAALTNDPRFEQVARESYREPAVSRR
ncbi:protein kinase domain-containing protein [Gemmatimonas sp.]